MKGAQFTLQEFHDNFMKQGFPPIKIVRQGLLGNNSPDPSKYVLREHSEPARRAQSTPMA